MTRIRTWPWANILLTGVLACAFSLSYHAWRDVAMASGIGPHMAILAPLLVDFFALLIAWAASKLSGGRRVYAWSLLCALAGTTVWGNAIHAHPVIVGDLTLTAREAMFVAALPAGVLVVGIHLVQWVRDAKRPEAVPVVVSPAAGTTGAHTTSQPRTNVGTTTSVVRKRPARTISSTGKSSQRDQAFAWLEEHRDARPVDLQKALGVAESNASRWVRDWRKQGPRLAAVGE